MDSTESLRLDYDRPEGIWNWKDLYYFGALTATRHGVMHLTAGLLNISFGTILVFCTSLDTVDRYSSGMGGFVFITASMACFSMPTPKTAGME